MGLTHLTLPAHSLKIALLQPQIAPNTGNIARLCVATGTELHLVRPLGFVLGDRELKRSAMDYWPRLRLTVHDDTAAFLAASAGGDGNGRGGTGRRWLFSSKGRRSFWEADFADGDWLVFGSETRGIDESLLDSHANHALRIPQAVGERCLNLSTAAGIGLYHALSRIQVTGTSAEC